MALRLCSSPLDWIEMGPMVTRVRYPISAFPSLDNRGRLSRTLWITQRETCSDWDRSCASY